MSLPTEKSGADRHTSHPPTGLEPGTPAAEPKSFADPNLGRVLLGRYRIDEYLGCGGMGDVYVATQLNLDRQVVLKLLARHLVRVPDANFVDRFNLEAAVSAKLSHPNIVTIHDYGEDNGQLFMAMEYLQGHSLDQLVLNDGPMPLRRVLELAVQIARALRFAHNVGVAHRDLKPENVIVLNQRDEEDKEILKLLDFGLAKIFDSNSAVRQASAKNITRTGALLGSPKFMAPEQISQDPIGPHSDIYSLGALMYFMVSGRAPYDGASVVQILHRQMNESPPPVPDCPPEIFDVILRCMHKYPEDRYPTTDSFLRDLRAAAQVYQEESGGSGIFRAFTADQSRSLDAISPVFEVSDADVTADATPADADAGHANRPEIATQHPPDSRWRKRAFLAIVFTLLGALIWNLSAPDTKPPAPLGDQSSALSPTTPRLPPLTQPNVLVPSSPSGQTVKEPAQNLGTTAAPAAQTSQATQTPSRRRRRPKPTPPPAEPAPPKIRMNR